MLQKGKEAILLPIGIHGDECPHDLDPPTAAAMHQDQDELEAFKTRVNLTEFAAALRYTVDRKASSRNSAVMVHPAHGKIVVAVAPDGHWVYFNVHDADDNGSIIDFAQRRLGGTLGDIRKTLRPWLGAPSTPPLPRPAPASFVERLEPVARDLVMVRARFESMQPVSADDPYLVGERRVPSHLLTHPRFEGRIRRDERGNIAFPHFNRDGLCGYELKNRGFTGFAPGGTKGLWLSQSAGDDRRLVITETAIDALSYAAIRGVEGTRLASVAGTMNPEQPALLRSATEELPVAGRVVLAFDNDAGGDALTERVTSLFAEIHRSDLAIVDDRPVLREMDWNDVLRGQRVAPLLRHPNDPQVE